MAELNRFLCVCAGFLIVTFCSALPELQQSVEWKFQHSLYEYKTYGAVTVERIDIPAHAVYVSLNSSVKSSSSDCPLRSVKIFANQFGFPVVSRDEETFPDNVFVSKTEVRNITVLTNGKFSIWQVEQLMAGQLFLMAVLPKPDSRIQQQGLQEKCDYYMSTQAVVQHFAEEDIPQLLLNTSNVVTLTKRSQIILRFKVPLEASSYTVDLYGCMNTSCPVNVSLWETLSASINEESPQACHWDAGRCKLQVQSPAVDRPGYLTLYADIDMSITILIVSNSCERNYNNSNLQLVKKNDTTFACTFVGELGRESPDLGEDGSNFNDQFVTWNKNYTPHPVVNLRVLDTSAVVSRFWLRISDTGTSLKLSFHVPIEKLSRLVHVTLCLSAHRILHPRECDSGALLNVTNQIGNNKNYVIVPYPQTGHWYISLESQCFSNATNSSHQVPMPCHPPPEVNMSIHLAPCIDGGCGEYGTCKLYMEVNLLYSACNCYSGWRGFGCNDGSQAFSNAEERLGVYLLTLSNLAFLPSICLALYRRLYVEAFVYSYNMFFSTFYHACDSSEIYQLCIMPYNSLSFADFFASLLSFWVTLMAMARIPPGLRSLLHMVSALFISLGEVFNRHGLVEQLLPIAGGLFIMLLSWAVESYRRKSIFPSKRRLLKFILPGVSLSGIGLLINLAFQTERNYKYTHSSWHVLEATSILCLLPPRKEKLDTSSNLSVQSGDITRQSVLDSQEFQANFNHADDTGVRLLSPSRASSPTHIPTSWRESAFQLLSRRSSNSQSQNLVL